MFRKIARLRSGFATQRAFFGSVQTLNAKAARAVLQNAIERGDDVEQSLAMLDAFVDTLPRGYKPLHGMGMLLIQHQMGQHVAMVKALMKLGAAPHRIHCIDVPYSAHTAIVHGLLDVGVPEGNINRHAFRLAQNYHEYQKARVAATVAALNRSGSGPYVVLDDGCYFLEACELLGNAINPEMFSVVEQTARGINKIRSSRTLQRLTTTTSIVNVAESFSKKTVEPPHIALNAVALLMETLERPEAAMFGNQMLLLGFGAIGRALAFTVREQFGCDVTVFDVHEEARDAAKALGFRTMSDLSLAGGARFDIVLGCSGYPVLNPLHHHALFQPHTLMISASSGNHELGFDILAQAVTDPGSGGVRPLESLRCHNAHSLQSPAAIHDTITFELQHGSLKPTRLHYVNGGFPITFVGRPHAVPSKDIAPTIVLMVAGAIQAAEAAKQRIALKDKFSLLGIQPLNADVDNWVATQAASRAYA